MTTDFLSLSYKLWNCIFALVFGLLFGADGHPNQAIPGGVILVKSGSRTFCVAQDALLSYNNPPTDSLSIGGVTLIYEYPSMKGVTSLLYQGRSDARTMFITVETNLLKFDPTTNSSTIRQLLQARDEKDDFNGYRAFKLNVGGVIYENLASSISLPTIWCTELAGTTRSTCGARWLHAGSLAVTVHMDQSDLLPDIAGVFAHVEEVINRSQRQDCN